jgi:hypothetical protein
MIRIEVEISASVIQTIDTYSKVIWQHQLNGNGFFEVLVTGSDEDYVSYFQRGRVINFYKNDVLDLKGSIEKITFTSEGLMRIQGIELGAKRYANSSIDNASYTTNTNAVITKIQTLTNNSVTLGTINSDSFDSFRTHSNQNCLQVLSKLATLQGKDWYFDYSGGNVRVNLVNNKGVSKVALLNGGIDVDVVTKEEDDAKKVNKVTFIGAGEGTQQICCWYQVGWVAGCPEITCTDKSIATNAEALARATKEHAFLSATKYNYFFKVVDFNRSFATGDTIELVDKRTNTDAELRIVSIKRVATQDFEKLELEVRSTSDRERAEDKLRQDAALRSYVDNNNDMVQGADLRCLCACVAGDVCDCALSVTPSICTCNLSVTPNVTVCYNGAITANGYFIACSTSAYGCDGSWYGLNGVTVPSCACSNNKYLGHNVFFNINEAVRGDGTSFALAQHRVYWRIYNTSLGTYFPSCSGIQINCWIFYTCNNHCHVITSHCHSDAHCHGYLNVTVPSFTDGRTTANTTGIVGTVCTGATATCTQMSLTMAGSVWLPFDWYNTSYRLELCFTCRAANVVASDIQYYYSGILGHNHDSAGCCCSLSHAHAAACCNLCHRHCANLVGNVCYCTCFL